MRPKQINVFDGLRITTEHLDHLQGAFLTGLQDLREVSGLGRVVRGFEVAVEGEGRITVQPGLAFDLEKNRIACDEPKTLNAAFQEGEEALWVTIRYDQQETGEIEGKQTLIWDGCALELTPTEPPPDDLAITIARLTRGEDGRPVLSSPPAEAAGAGTPPPESGEPPPTPEGEAQPPAPGGNGTGESAPLPGANGATGAGAPVPESAPAMTRLAAAQGVARFTGPASPVGSPLPSLAVVVRGQAGQAAEGQPDLSLTLATADIPVSFTPVSLSCQVVLKASVASEGGGNGAAPDGYAAETLQSTCWGEVSAGGETLAQHALAQYPASGRGYPAPGPLPQQSLLVEGVVAQLPLSAWAETAQTGEAGPTPASSASSPDFAACRYLQLSVRATRNDTQGIQLILTLEWKGGYEEERIHLLETGTARFQTEALLAWKALGNA